MNSPFDAEAKVKPIYKPTSSYTIKLVTVPNAHSIAYTLRCVNIRDPTEKMMTRKDVFIASQVPASPIDDQSIGLNIFVVLTVYK